MMIENKIRKFYFTRFIPKGMFQSREANIITAFGQCVFIGMILSVPLSLELQRISYPTANAFFPDIIQEEYYILLSILGIAIYPVTIIMNLIFTLMISGLSMMLNFSASLRFNFREFFTFFSYVTTIPAILASLAGIFLSIAFVYLIYNFGSIFFAWFIYKNGQQEVFNNQC